MRELNEPQAYTYNELLKELRAVKEQMPFTDLVYVEESNNKKDGMAILTFSSPYNLTVDILNAVVDSGDLTRAMFRADCCQIVSSGVGEFRIYFIIRDVWVVGESLPEHMFMDINQKIKDMIEARKLAKNGPELHILE